MKIDELGLMYTIKGKLNFTKITSYIIAPVACPLNNKFCTTLVLQFINLILYVAWHFFELE